MKYFVFSDVHGCYDDMIRALNSAGYDKNDINHQLLFLGDAFDHNQTGHYKMYQFLKESIECNKLIWIKGNHEIYLLNTLKNELPSKFTLETIRDVAIGFDTNAINYSDEECIRVLKNNGVDKFIMDNTIDYFETKDYVFTHGFIPYNKKLKSYDENWRDVCSNKWNYFRCLNGQKLVMNGIKIPGKTLVCGHVGAYYGNTYDLYNNLDINSKELDKIFKKVMKNAIKDSKPFYIYYGDGVIGIDGRSYDTHNVNVLVVEQ